MKKIILISILCLLLIPISSKAQDEKYIITVTCKSLKNERGHKARSGSRFYVNGICADGQIKTIISEVSLEGLDENETRTNLARNSIEVDADPGKWIKKIEIWGHINVRNSSDADREGYSYITIEHLYPCLTSHLFQLGDDGQRLLKVADLPSTFEISVKPKKITPQYYNMKDSLLGLNDTLLLPDKHKITVKLKESYPLTTYKWQYQIGNLVEVNDRWVPYYISNAGYDEENYITLPNGSTCVANTYIDGTPIETFDSEQTDGCYSAGGDWTLKEEFNSNAWVDVPAAYNGQAELRICGNDLMSNFLEDVVLNKKQIRFRLDYGCGYSEIITLDGKKSAPTIESCTITPNTCFGANNATLTVNLSEPLLDNESINFSLADNLFSDEHSNKTKNDLVDGKSYTFTGLAGNITYNIALFGRYPYDESIIPIPPGSISLPDNTTFTGSPEHQKTVTIVSPGPLTLSASPTAVSCHNGNDGTLTVSMGGGTAPYRIYYNREGESIQSITNISTNTYTIGGLQKGTYTVSLRDSNACLPYKSDGITEKVESVTVAEPADFVKFASINPSPIKGYNRNDGSITVSAKGGNGGYHYKWWKDGVDFTPAPSQSNAQNLAPGKYFIMLMDSKYSPSCPSCLGCRDTITVELTQPDSLEVELSVRDVVKCFGDGNGSLEAHIKGGVKPYVSMVWEKQNGSSWSHHDSGDSATYGLYAGTYRLTVTDSTDNQTVSPPFTLTQPDLLKVDRFLVGQPSCSGYNDGWAEPVVTGGTQPYSYRWQGEITTPRIENLESDKYFIRITDKHGCTVNGFADVTTPTELKILAEVKQPTCSGSAVGSITLNVTGGAAPYTYSWGGVPGGASLHDLEPDTHTVTVTDAGGCFKTQQYELKNPEPLTITLGQDRTLCKDQQLEVNATINDPAARYQWYKDGVAYASTPSVSLSQAGQYRVEVTDYKGCVGEDDIRIVTSSQEIAATFAMSTKVARGKITKIVNTSHPAPEKSEWIVPEDFGVSVVSQSSEELELLFLQNGSYTIGLKSTQGACEQQLYKTIQVVDRHEAPSDDSPKQAFLKQFILYPNPSSGQFTVKVELSETANIRLRLISMVGVVVDDKSLSGSDRYEAAYSLSGKQQGTYILQLISDKANSSIKVVLTP